MSFSCQELLERFLRIYRVEIIRYDLRLKVIISNYFFYSNPFLDKTERRIVTNSYFELNRRLGVYLFINLKNIYICSEMRLDKSTSVTKQVGTNGENFLISALLQIGDHSLVIEYVESVNFVDGGTWRQLPSWKIYMGGKMFSYASSSVILV